MTHDFGKVTKEMVLGPSMCDGLPHGWSGDQELRSWWIVTSLWRLLDGWPIAQPRVDDPACLKVKFRNVVFDLPWDY